MDEYKPNSNKFREEQRPEKRIEKVVSGTAKTKKKSDIQKFADVFISDDVNKVKTYILSDVLIPAIKKAISDIVTTGIDMLLYGETGKAKKNSSASKVSYRSYYERENDRNRSYGLSARKSNFDYDDIIFPSRGDAEAVLDAMDEIISQYDAVSVLDLYDMADVPTNNYTLNRYGWTDIEGASVIRVRDGYTLKLPRAVLL